MVQRYKFSIELKNSPPDLSGEPEILHALRGEILLDRFSFTKKDLESVPMLYAILLRHLLFLCGV